MKTLSSVLKTAASGFEESVSEGKGFIRKYIYPDGKWSTTRKIVVGVLLALVALYIIGKFTNKNEDAE